MHYQSGYAVKGFKTSRIVHPQDLAGSVIKSLSKITKQTTEYDRTPTDAVMKLSYAMKLCGNAFWLNFGEHTAVSGTRFSERPFWRERYVYRRIYTLDLLKICLN